jgi:DNA invertase Pin-like site-specific DNA recombinase
MPELLGYARVLTVEQNADLQRDALRAAGCWKVFTDHVTGTRERRPELDRLIEQLRPGDTLVVWRLDRLGRSLRHLIGLVGELAEREVGFRSLTENIDTTTAGGRLIFHVFGALAEFERELILERTRAGTAAARARGRMGGRPSVLTSDKARAARRMYEAREMTVQQIAEVLGVGRSSIYRSLRRQGAINSPTPTTGSAAVARG